MVIGCGEVKDTVERLKLRENLLTFENSKLLNFSQKCKCGSITYHKRREVGTREGGKEKEREGGR